MSPETKNDKSYFAIIALSIVLVVMSLTIYAITQSGAEQGTADTITMSGYAEQKVVPDTASINIGVVIQAETAKEASDENAAIMTAVMKELKAIGLEDREIQTSYVSVYPVYNYDGEMSITGYSASNSVTVTTTNLDYLSDIVDKSTAAGANQIGSVSFSVSDDMQEQLREDLMAEAVTDAKSKADSLADSLGLKVTGVQTASVSDSSDSRVYYAMDTAEAAMEEGAPSTPISPGESTVSMSVYVTYYIG